MTIYLNQRRRRPHWQQWTIIGLLLFLGAASLIYVLDEADLTSPDSVTPSSPQNEAPALTAEVKAEQPSPAPANNQALVAPPPEASDKTPAEEKVAEPAYTVIRGSIEGSLYGAFSSQFPEDKENQLWADKAAAHFKRIFLFDINFKKDLRPKDSFALAFEKTDHSTDGMRVLAAWYQSAKLKQDFYAVYLENERYPMGRYFQPDGDENQQRLKNSPIKDYEIITALLHDRRPRHDGIDFKAPVGTPIITPFDAKVLRKNWSTRRNGNCLDLRYTGKPHRALFLHLNDFAEGIRPGVTVKAGTVIATVGNTGRSYAPHLHYQVENMAGRVLDPLKVHGTRQAKADETTRKAVKALWATWEPQLKKEPSESISLEANQDEPSHVSSGTGGG